MGALRDPTRWHAERRRHPPRRQRFLALRLLRIVDRDAERRSAGGERAALHELPRHAGVLPDASELADGPQPPFGRDAQRRRLRHRLPEHARRDPAQRRDPRGDAAAARLRHVHGREVAPDAGAGVLAGRPVPQPSTRARVRPVLRVPRRRDRSVPARARRRERARRSAASSRATATTSPRIWSTTRRASCATTRPSHPSGRSSSTPRSARRTRRITRRSSTG